MSVTAFNRQRREMANKKVTKVTEVTKVIKYEEMTKAEIAEKLSALGIDFDARQKKEELIELLKASK